MGPFGRHDLAFRLKLTRRLPLAAAAASFFFQTLSVHAEPYRTRAELVSEVAAIRASEPFWVGIRLQMEPGWHTYWKNPGDSGLPTRVEWELPDGFKAGPLVWPAPARFGDGPVANYGYEGSVLLMAKIVPPPRLPAGRIKLSAKVRWMECEELCVPGKSDLSLELRAKPSPEASQHAPLFAAEKARQPRPPTGWSLRASRSRNRIVLRAAPPPGIDPPAFESAAFFSEIPGQVRHAAPQKFYAQNKTYIMELEAGDADPVPSKLKGAWVLKRKGADEALEVDVPISSQ